MTPKPKPPRVAEMIPASELALESFRFSNRARWTLVTFAETKGYGLNFFRKCLLGFSREYRPEQISAIRGCGPATLAEIRATIQKHLGADCPEAWR